MMSLSLSHFFKPSLLHVNTFLDTSHEPVISSNLSVRALERATIHRYLIVLEYQGYKIKTHQTRPDQARPGQARPGQTCLVVGRYLALN
jgi:hypothetical protein